MIQFIENINRTMQSFCRRGFIFKVSPPAPTIFVFCPKVADLQAQVAFLQGGDATYGNSSFSSASDTSLYQTGSYQEDDYYMPTETYSLPQSSYDQPVVNHDDSYNLVDQPTYGLYHPAYDSYTSPVSDAYAAPRSTKNFSHLKKL